jgi:hypothetical protein
LYFMIQQLTLIVSLCTLLQVRSVNSSECSPAVYSSGVLECVEFRAACKNTLALESSSAGRWSTLCAGPCAELYACLGEKLSVSGCTDDPQIGKMLRTTQTLCSEDTIPPDRCGSGERSCPFENTALKTPTDAPSGAPADAPSDAPTDGDVYGDDALTDVPTAAPTSTPTAAPTTAPTAETVSLDTAAPTVSPTAAPTTAPTAAPTSTPTAGGGKGGGGGAPTTAPTVCTASCSNEFVNGCMGYWMGLGRQRPDAYAACRNGVDSSDDNLTNQGCVAYCTASAPLLYASPVGAPTSAPTVSPTAAPSGSSSHPACTASCSNEFVNGCMGYWMSRRYSRPDAYAACMNGVDSSDDNLANQGCVAYCTATEQMLEASTDA